MEKEFAAELEKIDVAQLTSELVKIPSYSFLEEQEKDIASFICELFKKEGIESDLIEIRPGRYNVYAKLRGKGKGKSLMLSGHIDTIPPYDMNNAFSGRREGGKVYGRGACNMKGSLSAMIAAVIALKRAGICLQGDLYFTGLADEEEQGRGVEYLVEYGPFSDAVIVGQPTDMKIAIGHKGLEWIDVIVSGRRTRCEGTDEGVNAIEMASRFVQAIYTEYAPKLKKRKHPLLGAPTVNIGRIEGGDQPSMIAGECLIKLDRRWVPEENSAQVYAELEEICSKLHEEDPRFNAVICDTYADAEPMLPHRPYCIDKDDPLVLAVQQAMASAEGCQWSGEITAFPAWTDAGAISSVTDSKCIVVGPGELGVSHSVHEYVYEKDVQSAALIYGLTAMNYCK